MNVGFVQFAPTMNHLDKTIKKLDQLFSKIQNAQLIVLPELCNSGYNFASYDDARRNAESIENSRFIHYLQSVCKERKTHIVSGFNEQVSEGLYNSAVLVGADGVIGLYRKLHLFYREKQWFLPGNCGLPVFDIATDTPMRLGMLICYDWQFSEVWRILALKGVDIICHPSNLVIPDLAQRGVPFHAISNRLYIVTANRIGSEGDLTFTGQSMIINTRGEIIAKGEAAEESVMVQAIDVMAARDKQLTDVNNLLDDRRVQEYSSILTKWEGNS
ncbi:MAG: acyltransferase [Candidatus Magnetoovum sp. WYHC-5]|nr:acyltransferase [Candidatus Magnetoovum sp. WYHC-5]